MLEGKLTVSRKISFLSLRNQSRGPRIKRSLCINDPTCYIS